MKKLDIGIFAKDEMIKEEGYVEIVTEDGVLELPVYIIQNGKGPRITVVGAQHSCEYCGTDAIIELIQDFRKMEPSVVNGSVVLIPVANIPGYPLRALNVSQFDGSNLNRSYPGNPKGTTSERIAHTIWSIAKTGNYVLDLHGGDMNEDIIQYAEMHVSEKTGIMETSLKMAACFDLDVVLLSIAGTDYAYPDFYSLYGLSQENEIPAAIIEAGGSGISDDKSVEYFYEGLKNVLNVFGFTKMEVKAGFDQVKKELMATKWVSSITRPNRGIFKAYAKAGDCVKKGEVIAEVFNYLGEVIDKIKSPRNGIVSLVQSCRGKSEKDMVYMIIDTDLGEMVEIK